MDDLTNPAGEATSVSQSADEPAMTSRERTGIWQAFIRPAAGLTVPADRRQARLLASVLVVLVLVVLMGAISALATGMADNRLIVNAVVLMATEIVLLVAYGLSRTVHYRIGAAIALAVLTAMPIAVLFLTDFQDFAVLMVLMLAAVLSSVFFSRRGVAVTTGLGLLGLLLLLLFVPDAAVFNLMSRFAILLATGGALVIAARFRDLQEMDRQAVLVQQSRELEAARATLETRVAERTLDLSRRAGYLEATSQVAQEASSLLDVDDLLSRVVTLVSEQFGFYHTGVFLLDATAKWAVLQAASSEGGQYMLARGHRLPVGTGIVGYAVAQGEHRIALDVGLDAVFFDNPDLPDTRSEMALPLRARNEIIGALDVQSLEPEAFTDEDVAVLQTLADQVALAISNARLFAQAQDSLEAERRSYGELSQVAWMEMIQGRQQPGYRYHEHEVVPIGDGGARSESTSAELPVLELPVKYRDQIFGTIEARKPAEGGAWTPEEIALMETLTEQLSVALDSARLHQSTQRRAAREELLGSLATRIRQTLDVESVLKTTAQEVREALGLPEVVIRLAGGSADGPVDSAE